MLRTNLSLEKKALPKKQGKALTEKIFSFSTNLFLGGKLYQRNKGKGKMEEGKKARESVKGNREEKEKGGISNSSDKRIFLPFVQR